MWCSVQDEVESPQDWWYIEADVEVHVTTGQSPLTILEGLKDIKLKDE